MILLSFAINKYYYYVIIDKIFLPKAAHHVSCTFYTEPSKGKKNIFISENNDTSKNNDCLITTLPNCNWGSYLVVIYDT